MNPRYIMTASSIVFGLVGFGLLFLPTELMAASGLEAQSEFLAQLAASGFLAMASLDWMGRSAIYGGIYGRPIVVSNLGFGFISVTTLATGISEYGLSPSLWILVGVLGLHVFAFARLMTRPPWNPKSDVDSKE